MDYTENSYDPTMIQILIAYHFKRDNEPPPVPNFTGGFLTGRGQKVNVSAASLQKARDFFLDGTTEGDDTSPSKEAASGGGFGGFRTGRGDQVQISEVGLRKAHSLLNGAEEEHIELEVADDTPKANETSESDFGNKRFDGNAGAPLGGFQTGRGKKVQVSEQSLRKANALFEENMNDFGSEGGKMGGFQTGRGVKVAPSKESIDKALTLFGQDDTDGYIPFGNEEDAPPLSMGGFQTGKGVRVEPSKESMNKAMVLFREDEEGLGSNGGAPPMPKGGFQTGRGMKVAPSKESMNKAMVLFGEEDNSYGVIPFGNEVEGNGGVMGGGMMGGGFQTGRGKQVQVSEKALGVARSMFKEEEEEMDEIPSSFTADPINDIRLISYGTPEEEKKKGGGNEKREKE